VLAVADAFDAMTSDRPYRDGLSLEEARASLIAGRGSQFDPAPIDALIALIDEGGVAVRTSDTG
jgi:HD-GYP domain-containing protein (c-di-GMP phosphodiesterase class II)